MSHSTELGGAIDTTHIYYNISVTNNFTDSIVNLDVSGNPSSLEQVETYTLNKELAFNQFRSQPYLVNPSEYFMSVVRFTVDTPTLPILIVQPRVGTSFANSLGYPTVYTITMRAGSVDYTRTIYWSPDDRTVDKPVVPIQPEDQTNPFFYCYSVFSFLYKINSTLESLYRQATSIQSNYPYMNFDPSTNLFTLGGDVANFRTSKDGVLLGTGTQVGVYFNSELYNLFSSLPAIYRQQSNGKDYQLLFSTGSDIALATNQPYIENVRTRGGANDVYSTQEYSTVALWNPVKSLVFRANILSPVPELVGNPYIFSSVTTNFNQYQQNSNIEQVLIDHIVPHTTGFEGRPSMFYEPKGEYRLSDLQGNNPVNGLSITTYWKDWQNNVHPVILGLGCSATIKILFRKKEFNSVLL